MQSYGNKGGEAVADVIFNDYNPSGRLPITYPKQPNGFVTYDHKPSEDFENDNKAQDLVLFPFGHGLSYTKFNYSNLNINKSVIDCSLNQNNILVNVDVTNVGSYPGKSFYILVI